LTQADIRIFGDSYVAYTSSVDGKGAFLREPVRHDHIAFFPSFERFHWIGLPTELPLEKKEAVERDPEILELRRQIAMLTTQDGPSGDRSGRKTMLYARRKALIAKALDCHREHWLQSRKDAVLLGQGKGLSDHERRADLFETLCLVFPERAHLANIMALNNELTQMDTLVATQHLLTLCTRDPTVTYRPGQAPIDARCPI
jgi:hypothetical protein